MEHKYSKITARDLREASVCIYGTIGDDINGDQLAHELNDLSRESDAIIIKINSLGGGVVNSLSVIGSIIGSSALTTSVIEGIAGSSSAVIALSCRRVKMNDYARLMIHSPFYQDDEGNKRTNLSPDEQGALDNMKGILVDLLSRRGKSKDEINSILKKDTWYTAQQAKEEGFIDEIINTGVASMAASLSLDKLVAFAIINNSPTEKTMKKLFALLKLGDDANEAEAYSAVNKLVEKVTDLESTNQNLQNEITAFKNADKENKASKIKDMVDKAIIDRKILEKDRTNYTSLAEKDFDSTKSILDSMPVMSKLTDSTNQPVDKYKDKSWDELDKMGNVLAEIKVKDPARFKELYKEKFGIEPKI